MAYFRSTLPSRMAGMMLDACRRGMPAAGRIRIIPNRFIGLLGLLLLGLVAAHAETTTPDKRGPSPEIAAYQNPEMVEIYRLRIVNDANGDISGSRDGGRNWVSLGHVVGYTERVTDQGYTASKWAPISAVAATAVNAIHIRTGYNAKDDMGMVFSILPREMLTEAGKQLQSFYSEDSSIYTDIPGGTAIFGGHWSPTLGNPIAMELSNGTLMPLPDAYVPRKGDIFVIRVMRPKNYPKAITFENRFGGMITAVEWDETTHVIGQVLKPVAGVGRFTGTQYTDLGRIRANHNGVIDISLSRFGEIGGIQIIPRGHAMSPEMVRTRTHSQWMVVGPLDARDPSWEGIAPLFYGYLRPSWSADDMTAADWRQRLGDRFLVDVRMDNGAWQPPPRFSFNPDLTQPLPAWAGNALVEMTHLRILFPVQEPAVEESTAGGTP